jgi:hypothetical protein
MSKKRKRQVRTGSSSRSAASQSAGSQITASRSAASQGGAAASLSGTSRSWRDDFNPDYSYVIKDLRRIGALAGTFLAILIVLSFFLR